jgi:hypothetical protein
MRFVILLLLSACATNEDVPYIADYTSTHHTLSLSGSLD